MSLAAEIRNGYANIARSSDSPADVRESFAAMLGYTDMIITQQPEVGDILEAATRNRAYHEHFKRLRFLGALYNRSIVPVFLGSGAIAVGNDEELLAFDAGLDGDGKDIYDDYIRELGGGSYYGEALIQLAQARVLGKAEVSGWQFDRNHIYNTLKDMLCEAEAIHPDQDIALGMHHEQTLAVGAAAMLGSRDLHTIMAGRSDLDSHALTSEFENGAQNLFSYAGWFSQMAAEQLLVKPGSHPTRAEDYLPRPPNYHINLH